MNRKSRNKQLLRNTWDKYMDCPFWLATVCGVLTAIPVVLVGGLLAFPFVAAEYLWKRERQ